jgi:GTPase SAR1 family protein
VTRCAHSQQIPADSKGCFFLLSLTPLRTSEQTDDSQQYIASVSDIPEVSLKSMAGNSCSVRIVILGGAGVGKTAIVKRFLFHTFTEKYRATVEDLFFKEFNYGTLLLKVSIMSVISDRTIR